MLKLINVFYLCFIFNSFVFSQFSFSGNISCENKAISNVSIQIKSLCIEIYSDSLGDFSFESNSNIDSVLIQINHYGYDYYSLKHKLDSFINIELSKSSVLEDVVISGTMKAVKRTESPVVVEVYTQAFLKKNPVPSVFDALQNVNGVRPQLNCNICNTGDIHINGLEGPYTMILIDGMPIVSSLGTVYGLSGIPNSLIERIEVVKGPASSLYGSEAVGGLINIITKKVSNAPKISLDLFSTSWLEHNFDLGFKLNLNKKIDVLTGINYFNFQNRVDKNKDNFTDVTLQNRFSVFQKWNVNQKSKNLFSIVTRFLYENRWGGEMQWNESFRGGDQIYGESIFTKRFEILGSYQLPLKERIVCNSSYIYHDQDSRYGTTSYIANQKIAFSQLVWDKKIKKNDFLLGAAIRYTLYDDNTPATATKDYTNRPDVVILPGIFFQDELKFNERNKLLTGLRWDYNNIHGPIFTPRIAYKWILNSKNVIRFNSGTGFRVVNLFTEDHAALTGARDVVIQKDLKPEKSYNANVNYVKHFYLKSGAIIDLDFTSFYTYFTNRIVADYDLDPNLIIYNNLSNGYAESKGISLNADVSCGNGLKLNFGGTLMENTITEEGVKKQQILTENFTGTWSISYKIKRWFLNIDYTGNIYSPMRLPLVSELDPRNSKSPWWSIQNIQLTFSKFKYFEFYGGVKNLLNYTPNKNSLFLIARSHDPFDNKVNYDQNGKVLITNENPYGLTFDPTYLFAPNQGVRIFFGIRFNIN